MAFRGGRQLFPACVDGSWHLPSDAWTRFKGPCIHMGRQLMSGPGLASAVHPPMLHSSPTNPVVLAAALGRGVLHTHFPSAPFTPCPLQSSAAAQVVGRQAAKDRNSGLRHNQGFLACPVPCCLIYTPKTSVSGGIEIAPAGFTDLHELQTEGQAQAQGAKILGLSPSR